MKQLSETSKTRKLSVLLRYVAFWSALPIGLVALTFAMHGRPLAEKVATGLVMPVAFAWWSSLLLAIRSFWDGHVRVAWPLLFVSMTTLTLGNPIFSSFLIRSLESRVESFQPTGSEPLDTLVVLGGGTSEAPDGRAQLANGGDRVGMAAQLYHQGLVKRIVVTGDGLIGTGDTSKHDPSIQAKQILMKTGVPESGIEELAGMNTSQEMKSLAARPELWQGLRCGLLTSAFHLPRAFGLAIRNGIEVVPIAADFRASNRSFTLLEMIPTGSSAQESEIAIKEYLGMMLGR